MGIKIDWDEPLEAVDLTTGEATPVTFDERCDDGSDDVCIIGVPDTFEVFRADGSAWIGEECHYRIRNVGAE